MDVSINGAPVYFTLDVFGGIPISATLVVTWVIMLLLTGLCIWMTRDLKVTGISKKQAVAEFLVTTAENFVLNNMGKKWSNFIPFVAALFALSICSSLSGLLGVFAPTADLSTELSWAVVVFIMITATKIKTGGLGGYLKGFTQPIFVLTPFNVISELATPISMAFRHFGNIVSGTVISTLVYAALTVANRALFGLIPGFVGDILGEIPFLTVGIPAVLSLYFDWFSSFMQAFIFSMLTMMYIATAAEDG
ncbi:F0F1 ATP synthase subunit A [uncultured Ruthenibacterium sp.]|uniref:F0F1 ATP synthase subunit A n=1 Tax=uncultured Ruthenibacterium sp. TaxID=1905347 RepID=UPI00349EA94C